jgi:hypothetical protein
MSIFDIILAAMLFLQPPGKSIYSQVVVEQNAPPPCAETNNLLCQPPHFSAAHKGYTVAENYEQGTQRYAAIAKQLEKVVNEPQWATQRDKLWRLVLVAIYHESGFRRDVHSGIGESARGDCDWTGPVGKRKRVPNSCRSYCLGQIMLISRKTANGWAGDELVGLADDATYRCLYMVTKYMDSSAQSCIKQGNDASVSCVMNMYGGGSLLRQDPRLIARYKTYNRLKAAPSKLDTEVLKILGVTGAISPVAKAKP